MHTKLIRCRRTPTPRLVRDLIRSYVLTGNISEAARQNNLPASTARKWLLESGAHIPAQRQEKKPVTTNEVRHIKQLRMEGYKYHVIAELTGRSISTVIKYCKVD